MVKKLKIPIIVVGAVSLGFFIPKIFTHLKPGDDENSKESVTVLAESARAGSVHEDIKSLGETPDMSVENPEKVGGGKGEAVSEEVLEKAEEIGKGEVEKSDHQEEGVEKTSLEKTVDSSNTKKREGDGGEDKPNQSRDKEDQGQADKITDRRKTDSKVKIDEYGFEVVGDNTSDFVEVENRLLALEQAFSVDGRRNKGRGGLDVGGGWGGDEEIVRINESLSNLYEIVEKLPSIDTLQAKMNAVDTAIVEMNDTIEAINVVAKKMQDSEIDVALKVSGEAVQAANEALGEVKKLGESVSALENDGQSKEAFAEHEKKAEVFSQQADVISKKVEELETTLFSLRGEIEELKTKQEGVAKNITLLDKNINVLSSSYKMVYDNALRVDSRLGKLEEGSEKVEKRVLLLENNLLPPE